MMASVQASSGASSEGAPPQRTRNWGAVRHDPHHHGPVPEGVSGDVVLVPRVSCAAQPVAAVRQVTVCNTGNKGRVEEGGGQPDTTHRTGKLHHFLHNFTFFYFHSTCLQNKNAVAWRSFGRARTPPALPRASRGEQAVQAV